MQPPTRPLADNSFQLRVARGMVVATSTLQGAGKGVFWMGDTRLPPGRLIGVYAGEVRRVEPRVTTYSLQLGPRTFVQPTKRCRNWVRFANDGTPSRRRNNAVFTATGRVKTTRAIPPGAEVLIRYGRQYWKYRAIVGVA